MKNGILAYGWLKQILPFGYEKVLETGIRAFECDATYEHYDEHEIGK